MVVAPPQQGVVTVVATYGQFYTNVGARENLCAGAEMLLVRGGNVIARARVIKVNILDSIAELLPEYRVLVPEAGDVVIVQSNPTQPVGARRSRNEPLQNLATPTTCRPYLPAIEPDMDTREYQTLWGVAILSGIILAIAND